MSIFTELKEPDYKNMLLAFEPEDWNISDFADYRTPSRSYIKASARGISFDDMSSGLLEYMIAKCHQCSMKEKYEACLILLYKLYLQDKTDKEKIEQAKIELGSYIENAKTKIQDLSFLDDIIAGYECNFFYLLEISIGNNKVIKFGITNTTPRKRIAQLKSDIAQNYKQSIVITPLLILHCNDSEKLEEEVKMVLSESGIFKTNYNFKGSTETIQYCNLNNISSIIDNLEKRFEFKKLYTSNQPI